MAVLPVSGDDTHKTILQRVVGEKTQELDVSIAIGRENMVDVDVLRERLRHEGFYSDFEPYVPESLRRQLGSSDKKFSKIYESEVIDYNPVKYEVNQTFD